jgi:hypothetical protein
MNIFLSISQGFADNMRNVWLVFANTWFLILPVGFYYLFKLIWMDKVQIAFLCSIEYALLEIIPPRDIERSPKPMESFFAGLTGVLKTFNAKEEYIKGMLTYKFGLELVSDGGATHIYIRTPKIFRNLVEANLYAQYPTVEIMEVPDFVLDVPKIIPNKDWDLWGTDLQFVKPDPFPIKTYKKFEETVTGTMIDPMSAIIEVMGKVGPNQKIWFQYVIYPEKDSWFNTGLALVQELAGRSKKSKGIFSNVLHDIMDVISNLSKGLWGEEFTFATTEEKKDESPLEFRLTPGEKDTLKALEENVGKPVFKVKMRFIYLGLKEYFDKSTTSSFIGAIKQFNDNNLNGFKPHDETKTYANYFLAEQRIKYRKRRIFKRFIERDPTGLKLIMSTEELATVFHLPDMSVMAPHITRVDAKKGGAPTNLPI